VTLKIIDFRPEHIDEMIDLGAQQWIKGFTTAQDCQDYADNPGPSITATYQGEIIGCAGIYMVHDYRGIAWAIMDQSAHRHFLEIHLKVKTWLRQHTEIRRIDAIVDPGFENAMKWVKLLGFKQESIPMESFLADGRSAVMWAKINK
jgi:RimJ/RimL family protein N-acetyltransferase